jgi:hypothetical protein
MSNKPEPKLGHSCVARSASSIARSGEKDDRLTSWGVILTVGAKPPELKLRVYG